MKSELRKKYRNIRNAISEKERQEKSKRIFEALIEHKKYQLAKKIFLYKSIGSEVVTDLMIDYSFAQEKQVAVPVIAKGKGEMIFAQITSETNFIENSFHIPQPEHIIEITSDEHTLIVVPGLVFDQAGFRIGYGGGYYDRYLQNNTSAYTIGICYREQMIQEIEVDLFDRAVACIVID